MNPSYDYAMTTPSPPPLGTPGVPWGDMEVAAWLSRQTVKRSYEADVLRAVEALCPRYEAVQYGRLDHDTRRYPLMALESRHWNDALPIALVTGGVHGYETSGVHGALRFADLHAETYAGRVNLLIVPCVSPWAYEVVHRWNPRAIDPNRSFRKDSPALAARDGVEHVPGVIRYPFRRLGLCAGMTRAPYRTTTEVYPDSPRATPEQCIAAQVAAVCAAIDYAWAQRQYTASTGALKR